MRELKKFVTVMVIMMILCCAMPVSSVNAASGYGFKSQGVTVKPGDNADRFIKANSKYLTKTTNEKSCIAQSGYDVKRVYKYFTIVTFASAKNGNGELESITITNPNVTTPEGLHCGMDESKVTDYYKNAKAIGSTYSAVKGNTKILIKIKNKKVSAIEYLYIGNY